MRGLKPLDSKMARVIPRVKQMIGRRLNIIFGIEN